MNIKIVFENKIHKLPKEIQDFEQITRAVTVLYPDKMKAGFNLYIKINPQDQPIKILDEKQFSIIKSYFTEGRLKILVKLQYQICFSEKEIELLDQSILSLSESRKESELIQTIESSFDTLGQIKPLTQNFFLQKAHEENSFKTSSIDKIKILIEQFIDERLEFHGLILYSPQPNYKMQIIYSLPEILVTPTQYFLWKVELLNVGNVSWKQSEVFLKCTEGEFVNEQIKLSQDIPPEKVGTFSSKLRAPRFQEYSGDQVFRLCHKQINETFFGKEIRFRCIRQNSQRKVLQGGKKSNSEQFKQFVEFTGEAEQETQEFLELFNSNSKIDELITTYYQE